MSSTNRFTLRKDRQSSSLSQDISVPVKFLSVIEKLKTERDAVVIMDSKTRLTVKEVGHVSNWYLP